MLTENRPFYNITISFISIITFACIIVATPSTSELPFGTADFATYTATSTLIADDSINAYVNIDALCRSGTSDEHDVITTLSKGNFVIIIGRDEIGNWILVRVNGFADCWVEKIYLSNDFDATSLPFIPTPFPPDLPNYPPIEAKWKVLYFECSENGKVISVTIDLEISGGKEPYITSPTLPINAIPKQLVSINITSDTIDGEPSGTISFAVPREADFKCEKAGNNPGPTNFPDTPKIPTNTPKPPPTRTNTSIPLPTNTPAPPTNTPCPTNPGGQQPPGQCK